MTQVAPLPDASKFPTKLKLRSNLIRLLLGLIVLAGFGGFLVWRSQPRAASNILPVSGRIDGYETDIGVKRAGRIVSIAVREGEAVKKGQQLLTMDDSNEALLQEQLRGAIARVSSAKSDEQQAISDVERVKSEIAQIESQIREAQLNLQQSRGDTTGRVEQAQANVATAKAHLAQAEAQVKQMLSEVKLAKINRDRYQKLVTDGAVNQQQFDQAQTAYETDVATLEARQAAVKAARQQLNAAEAALVQAQTTSLNPDIRNAQIQALVQKREQSQAQLQATQAKVKSAAAKVRDAQASQQQIVTQIKDAQKDLNVVSPLDGVVTARSVEPGAVVNAQTNILTIVDPKNIYLRGFIPQGDIGQVRLGQTAKIYIDSATSQKPLPGRVIAIDPQASFTPENIYFQKDRVRQVVGVRIQVDNPEGCFNPEQPYTGNNLPCAKIGMPADAEIILKPSTRPVEKSRVGSKE